MGKNRVRHNAKARQGKRGDQPSVALAADSNAEILDTCAIEAARKAEKEARAAQNVEGQGMSKKKRKRLEQYIAKKLKKEERAELLQQLSTSSFGSALLRSTARLGQAKETKREQLQRALLEEKLGLEPSTNIYVNKPEYNDESEADQDDSAAQNDDVPRFPVAKASLNSVQVVVDGGMSSDPPGEVGDTHPEEPPCKKRKKAKPKKKMPVVEKTARPGDSSDSDLDLGPVPICAGGSTKQRIYVVPDRLPETQEARLNLPVVQEEDRVMETIHAHDVTVLCGETGSGKTTQVPQFLYEAGFSHPDSDYSGWIGITQPRRVAAVSMAQRVGNELNAKDAVSYQIRFAKTTTSKTRIHFMTDGVLLKEVGADLLLSKYSVMIVDEAHERNLNTDILIGVLSRVVTLRAKMYAEWGQKRDTAARMGVAFEEKPKATPLKLIIMSATLRVSDFTDNTRLFSTPPPVLNVQARQYPVTVHFNRQTPRDHIQDAYRKVCKIHARLPPGGILVFLTGLNEIYDLITRLDKKYGKNKTAGGSEKEEPKVDPLAMVEDRMAEVDAGSNGGAELLEETRMAEYNKRLGVTRCLVNEDSTNKDGGESMADGDGANDDDEYFLSDDDEDIDADLDEESGRGQQDDFDDDEDEGTSAPLHILPLYSLLPTEAQMRVFDEVPEGHRLCVVATNVAETSLTIPGIRYVVDCGKVKEKVYDPASSIQSFVVNWTSKASADQRAGRAGRTGPGHCYRLYSSAVFDNQFSQFSEPEVLRMPIEGIVLQLKAMGIDNVVNFPFPTPPNRTDLARAEKLLKSLGALSEQGKITPTGSKMSQFPIHPRFSKMLLLGMQQGLIEYVIAMVAALSVSEVFVSPQEIKVPNTAEPADKEEAEVVNEQAEDRPASQDPTIVKHLRQVLQKYAGKQPMSDALLLLSLVGAYEYAGATPAFCKTHLLRPKAMSEIRALRKQLTAMVQAFQPKLPVVLNPRMAPPSAAQQVLLRQLLLAGFVDQLALPHPSPPLHYGNGPRLFYYQTMLTGAQPCAIERTSVLLMTGGPPAQAIVFTNLHQGTSMVWMKGITAIDLSWVASVAPHMCAFGKPLEVPSPTLDASKDMILAHVQPSLGPHNWELPLTKRPLENPALATSWFARLLLEGKILQGFASLGPHYATAPAALTKDAYKYQKKVVELTHALASRKVQTKAALLAEWKCNPKYLLEAILPWIKPEAAEALKKQWPIQTKAFLHPI